MEPKKLLTTLAVVMVVLFTGCKKDTFVETPGLCPLVVSTDPVDAAINVPLNKVITATFNENMNPLTFTPTSFTLELGAKGEAVIAGTVTCVGAVASFTPSSALTANTLYRSTLKTSVKDLNGNALQVDYVWTFSTGTLPSVTSTDPANLATGVVLNKVVAATFSVPMDPTTLTATTFTLNQGVNPIAGAVTYTGSTASFTPTASLLPSTLYTATITTGAKNVPGIPMAANYVWTFTTGPTPTVLSTDPANNATNVVLNKIVLATFSVPMDPSTLTSTTFTVKQGATPITGTVSYTGTTASFIPSANLLSGLVYTATITNGAKSSLNIPLAANYGWTFTTGTLTAPTVTLTDPADGDIGILLNKVVTATFSVPMDPLTITGTTFTLKQGATAVAGAVTYSGSTASFTPTANLTSGLVYTATITTGVKDVPGTSMANDYVWTFTSITTGAPSVTSTDPANLATGVALNKIVTANFSVPMDPLTLTATTFTLKQGATAIPGAVTYSGTTATFTPTANLTAGLVYTATVTTGAKNVLATALAADYVWTFTTGALTAPTVTLTDPANNATGVLFTKVLTATFSVPMDPTTITATTFTLKRGVTAVAGTITYSGSVATFTPTSILLSGTVYTATITIGAKNVAGTPLATNYVWTFTTVFTPPTVVSTIPLSSAINVPFNQAVSAVFSVPMNATTITGTTFTLMQGVTPVAGAVTYSGSTAVFTPTVSLSSGIVYTATVTTGAKNVAGTALAADYVWTFTTVFTPPTVVSVIPLNNAINVPVNQAVSANFSVPMLASTITGTTFTLKQGLTSIAGAVTYSGSTATFTPTLSLATGTLYTATITTGAKNVPGTALAADFVWTFTTVVVPPTVTSTVPLNAATGVLPTSLVTATFSVPMDGTTLTGTTFTLLQGLTPVAGVVSYSGSTATFTPSVVLMTGADFTATVTTGAKNAGGTPMASNYVWTFSTGAKGPGIVNLGTAANFAAIGKAGISTTGVTSVTGDIGVSPAAATFITGFGLVMDVSNTFATTVPTTLVVGKVYASDYTPPTPAYMTTAVSDMENSLTTAMGMTVNVINDLGAGDITSMTLTGGLYKYSTGLLIGSAGVTLSGGPNDTWVFQIAQDFTVSNGAIITLAGGAQAKNIFWVTSTQAVLGTTVNLKGNIISQTLISLNTGATVLGRLLAQTAVTLDAATVIKP